MLELRNIHKTYQHTENTVEAVKDLSLSVEEGEFVALVGPSGCGKTTLLKMIAGLLPLTSGEIILDGQQVHNPSKDRGMVFQSFTLFPWLNVKQNIAFGLELQHMAEKKKQQIVKHYLGITGLAEFADAYPKNLSGGMQQRVAIARTLANNPKILLMDEPFGSLDAQTRSQMQEFLTKLWEKEHKTILFITHDVGEAVFLANKVYVLSKRPMEIKKSFDVPFPRPRTHDLKQTKKFFEFELQIAYELGV
jgi:NitT/TauT family transport system ATP-binding protein